MSAGEISYLMELNKRKAELEFKKGYLLSKGKGAGDPMMIAIESELAEAAKQAAVLESRIMTSVEALFYPNEKEIAKLGSKLAEFKPQEIYEAMESRGGKAYGILEKRGILIKENYDRRRDIAALIDFANSLPSKTREEVMEGTRAGTIGSLDASTLRESDRARLFRLLNRAGVQCALEGYRLVPESKKGIKWNEVRVEVNGSHLWVEAGKEEEARAFGKELAETGIAIQVMNAERTVRKFGPEESEKFNDMQKKYLALLRKRDALVSD